MGKDPLMRRRFVTRYDVDQEVEHLTLAYRGCNVLLVDCATIRGSCVQIRTDGDIIDKD